MERHANTIDWLIGFGLFGATVLYLSVLPHNLGFADESYFLYEAKRLRDGEVLYRDVFQYVTPIAPYLMALLYWLFGTTMTTARIATAVLHGLIAVLLYASARTLRVAAPLALLAGVAHVAIAQPAWPFASWHWFSTCAATVILLILVRGRWDTSLRGVFALGAWCGVLIGIQQQRGVIPTAGVGLIIVLFSAIDGWRQRTGVAHALRRGVVFACGIAAIVAPLLLTFIASAGAGAVYHALVGFPMENYRASFQTTWGSISPLSRAYALDTFPRVLRFLPLALVVPALQAVRDFLRGDERAGRTCGQLILFAGVSCVSIWYYPDFIHIAFIAGPLLVGAALTLHGLLTLLPRPTQPAAAWVAGLLACGWLAQHLTAQTAAKSQLYRFPLDTAFGRVDFAAQWEPLLVTATRARLEQSATKELFCYPVLASPYLTTGGKNPTPFQHFHAPVFPPADSARVVAILEQRRVPYLLMSPFGVRKDDPIGKLVERDYRIVHLPELADVSPAPALWLFERRADHE